MNEKKTYTFERVLETIAVCRKPVQELPEAQKTLPVGLLDEILEQAASAFPEPVVKFKDLAEIPCPVGYRELPGGVRRMVRVNKEYIKLAGKGPKPFIVRDMAGKEEFYDEVISPLGFQMAAQVSTKTERVPGCGGETVEVKSAAAWVQTFGPLWVR